MAYKNRTDCHRVGAIVPANYRHVLSYYSGSQSPSIGIDCARDFRGELRIHWRGHHASGQCCLVGLETAGARFAAFGNLGKCTVCGARFAEGDVWQHTETGEHIHIGHDCAYKYSLLVDRSAYELELGRAKQAHAVALIKAEKAAARAAFLAEHPGLEIALATEHHIVRDIAQRFTQYTTLSDKQIALVLKLHAEVSNPRQATRADEAHVPAPVGGRVTFTGVVVSVKEHEGDYGISIKITVKVTTPAGTWLAWGTAPRAVLDTAQGALKGATVEITATLKAGRDAHFALMSRPNGRIITPGTIAA